MKSNRKLCVESLESRRVLAASLGWDGPGAGSAELTYHIGNAPASLSQPQVNAAIETALNAWSSVADIAFTPTGRSGLRDSLDISFRNLDGPGGVLAQAYFPDDVNSARVAGDIEFDASEFWEIGNGLGRSAFDLVAVAVHEIGHALGLDHSREAGSILFPSISPNQSFSGLSTEDVVAIRQLYAASPTATPAAAAGGETDEAPTSTDEETTPSEPVPRRNPWLGWRWAQRFGFWWGRFGRLEASPNESHNAASPTDVNGDSATSPLDVLLIVNTLNSGSLSNSAHRCDTNNDGAVSPVDALLVINVLNRDAGSSGDDSEPLAPLAPSDESDEPLSGESEDSVGGSDIPGAGEDATEPDSEQSDDDFPREPHHHFRGFGLGSFGFGPLGIGTRHGLLNERTVDRVFAAFDENQDGSLDRDEVPRLAWEYLERNGVDGNEDDLITLEEIGQFLAAQRLERFQALDASGDGLLDESELSESRWARLQNADVDADQHISFEELETFLALSRFDQVDGNRDGQIAEDEVPEHFWNFLVRFDSNNDALITVDEFPDTLGIPHRHEVVERIADRLAGLARRLVRNVRSL